MIRTVILLCLALGGPALAQCQLDLQTRLSANLSLPANAVGATQPFTLEDAFGLGNVFSRPVGVVRDPVNDKRLYIVGQRGIIYLIRDLDTPVVETFMNIQSIVDSSSNEEGLLGLAFHPDFANNGWFFVFFTTASNQGCGRDDVVARYMVQPLDDGMGDPGTRVDLIRQCDQASNHNGGPMHFGPDGYLYVALGDEGGANDTYNNGQRLDKDFFAGLLRIDVDKKPGNLAPNAHPAVVTDINGARYAVPVDNPFHGTTSLNGQLIDLNDLRTEFYAIGLRNPWQFSFDTNGDLYAADVGQNRWEEINLISSGGNYGWAVREGNHAGPESPPAGFTAIDPILEYEHVSGDFGGYSVTGGRVYRGSRFSDLHGHYVFADYASGNTWAFEMVGGAAQNWRHLLSENGTSAIGEDPRNGDLLFADRDQGVIRRLQRAPAGNLPPTLEDTGLFCDTGGLLPAEGVMPYELNVPFWSDGAEKRRWFSLPDLAMQATPTTNGPWAFPAGSVFVKHFDIETTVGDPASTRRLETRVIMKTSGGAYGLTYRWDSASNASLVGSSGFDEPLTIIENGVPRQQIWHYPSRAECLQCHTPVSGYVLGFHTAQLNRPAPGGGTNQIDWLHNLGYLDTTLGPPAALPAMPRLHDNSVSAAERVRSWLHANCSMCHQPGGTGIGQFDARFQTPTHQAGLVNGSVFTNLGDPDHRTIAPCDESHSMILTRATTNNVLRMPPLGRSVVDPVGTALLREWINDFCQIELEQVILPVQTNNMLRWSTQPGAVYRLEATATLVVPNWQPVATITAIGATTSYNLPGGIQPRRFYRVVLL